MAKSTSMEKTIQIPVPELERTVSGLFCMPENPEALLVLAHGAGAGMRHEFMTILVDKLAGEQIATLRYQFPYMDDGRKRPDDPKIAKVTVAAAVAEGQRQAEGLPLLAGGKSFGGRMTSMLASEGGLPQVRGLVFYGFPLHPAGRPATDRAAHLAAIRQPMLFLQGARDRLADADLIEEVCATLPAATLRFVRDGDHSFRTPKRTGFTYEQVIGQLAKETSEWEKGLVGG